MAVGLNSTVAASLLNALFNAATYTGPATIYAKLHIGDPGAAGAGNPAGNITRQAVSFGTAPGGTIANDVAVVWTNVSTSEDYTHVSLFDSVGPAGGNFLGSGVVTANAVTAADTFQINIGDLDVVITPVAA